MEDITPLPVVGQNGRTQDACCRVFFSASAQRLIRREGVRWETPTRGAVWVQRTSCPAGPSCPWAPIPPPQCSFPGGAQRRTLRRNIVLGTSCTTQWNEKAGQRSTFHRRQTRGDVAAREGCIAVHTAHLGVVCGVFAWCGVMSVVGWGGV